MKTVIAAGIACLCLTVASLAEDLAAELAPLAAQQRSASAAIAAQRETELVRLRQPYLAALAEADQSATKAGNAEALRAIAQEREDVAAGRLRQEAAGPLPRKLVSARRALITAELRTNADLDKKQKAVDTDYLQKLGALQPRAARDPILAAQIVSEKERVLAGINGPVSDLKTGLPGTRWRIFEGDGFKELHFGKDGKVNGNWNYETTARDKVKVVWDKTSSMTLTLGKNGSSLSAGDKTWVLDRK